MRIAFIIPHFRTGGAERVASLLCNEWIRDGHSVGAITFEAGGARSVFPLHRNIKLHQTATLNSSAVLLSRARTNVRRLRRIRAAIRSFEPDIVVAFTTEANVVAILAARGLGIPVIVSERNQPDRLTLGGWRKLARRWSYPLATSLVVQTNSVANWAREKFVIPVHVIPNPVALPKLSSASLDRSNRIVAVGRLVRQKGFDLLIEAFERIADQHPDWVVEIYGEGKERDVLERQIYRSPFSKRIRLRGITADIESVYAGAGIFVLPSRYEGFPNALLEALAAGCPVIAADCPGACSEILRGGEFGTLISSEDCDALARALDRLISDRALRAEYEDKAPEAVSGLEIKAIGRRWLEVFEGVCGQSKSAGS